MNHILRYEITPLQRRNPQYQWTLRSNRSPSSKARSLHDAIVRKHLGHKNTAQHIYQHGAPRLLCDVNASCRLHSATALDIQKALAEAANWIVGLASALFDRTRLEDLSPNLCEVRVSRISRIRKSECQVPEAKNLLRSRGKRNREVTIRTIAQGTK